MSTTFDDPADKSDDSRTEVEHVPTFTRKQTYTRQEVIDLLLDLRYGFETENPFVVLDDVLVMV